MHQGEEIHSLGPGGDLFPPGTEIENDESVGFPVVMPADILAGRIAQQRSIRVLVLQSDHGEPPGGILQGKLALPEITQKRLAKPLADRQSLPQVRLGCVAQGEEVHAAPAVLSRPSPASCTGS